MDLESLANELLLDIFEYLSSIDLFRIFYNLNIRFNHLIFLHFQTHILNFQSISKTNFDLICQNYLPSITNRIYSLHLSDDDDTPQQIQLFFSYKFSFQNFSYLKSLSIYRIYSFQSLEKLINELPFLIHLHYLKITRYNIEFNEIFDINIIDLIGHFSKLIYCYLDITNDNNRCIEIPSIISSSLKILSFPHLSCNITQLLNLIKNMSNLQSLHVSIVDHSTMILQTFLSSIKLLTIKKLNILFYGCFISLNNLLQTMTNLEELKINMPSTYINGYQWQIIIENNLSYLNNFQLKMSILLSNKKIHEDNINEILNSFRSQFWIEKHQWFIQCHWTITDASSIIYIYTLPYAFHKFLYIGNGQLKSTCPNDNQYNWSFDQIHNLYYHGYVQSQDVSLLSSIHLNNIQHLDLTIPFHDSFWLIVSTLNRLNSLNIVLNSEMNSNDIQLKLQILIDRSLNLRSLTYFSWANENIFPFEIKTSSIRQLDLRSPNLVYNYVQCIELCHSSIGQQCQVLLINVDQRINIIYLINHMNNLRSLIVKCSDILLQTLKNDQDLIQWLEQYLPSTCTISNTTAIDDHIRLWDSLVIELFKCMFPYKEDYHHVNRMDVSFLNCTTIIFERNFFFPTLS